MRAKLFLTLMLLMAYTGPRAQSPAITKANQIITDLRDRKYEELVRFADPKGLNILTPEVFMQIREVMSSPDGGMISGELTSAVIEGQEVVKADIPGKHKDLVMHFSKANLLTEFYLETHSYWVQRRSTKDYKYKDAPYADSTLYEEKHITVQTGEFILPGTLTLPKGKKNFPLLVYVHGSGDSDREENIYALSPFRDLALGLAAKGIASLRYDKRTNVYGIAAVPAYKLITIKEETTGDAGSAINLALKIPGVQGVYVMGHSLGGMMAPQIAIENKQLSGVIILSGPARSFPKSLEDQLVSRKSTDQVTVKSLKDIEMIKHVDTIADRSMILLDKPAAYWAQLSQYKQLEVAKKIKQPLLIMQGGRDFQVPFSDLAIWQDALKDKKGVTFKAYPKINHFYGEGTGESNTMEYFKRSNVPLYVIEDIANWIFKK